MKNVGSVISMLLWVAAIVPLFFFIGCASQEAYQSYVDTHAIASNGYYEVVKTPLVDITLPSPDPNQPYHIKLARDVKPMVPEQIKDSEWTGPIKGLISAAGMVGGIWAAGDAMSKITENSGGNTTSSNSGTINNSRDSLSNDGDGSFSHTGDITSTSTTTESTQQVAQ